jgi:cell division topological specificity factor
MSILRLFNKRSSGSVARERLQLILAHERAETNRPDLVVTLREEILAVIAKHVTVERDKVSITLDRGKSASRLCVDIDLPLAGDPATAKRAA